MNRLTAIGLASLVAYGLLIGSKYAGFVSAAREERAPIAQAPDAVPAPNQVVAGVKGLQPLPPHAAAPNRT